MYGMIVFIIGGKLMNEVYVKSVCLLSATL